MATYRIAPAIAALAFAATVASAQIRVEHDIKYTGASAPAYADNKDKLDIYIPQGAKNAPVIISLYGGALTAGDKSEQPYVGQRLAEAGNVTVLINYRLSPTVSHPAHAQDAAEAVAWVKKNIAKYGGDPNKLFLTGHSAGAYLITLLLLDPRYLAAHSMKPSDIRGAAPVSAFFYVEGAGVGPDRPKFIWGADPKAWPPASPATYVRKDLPPLLLLNADGDDAWRRQQQVDFAAALRKAGDENVQSRTIMNRSHLTVWYNMEHGQDETSRAIEDFVSKTLSSNASVKK
jgi:acetyl esterase/lipase